MPESYRARRWYGVDKAGRNIMGWTAGHLQETANPPDQSLEQRLLCAQYRVASEPFSQLAQIRGEEWYDRIERRGRTDGPQYRHGASRVGVSVRGRWW